MAAGLRFHVVLFNSTCSVSNDPTWQSLHSDCVFKTATTAPSAYEKNYLQSVIVFDDGVCVFL